MPDDTWSRYMLRQKMFSIGEDFWIENDRGETAFKVDGKALSLRETFVLEDPTGAELATIQSKLLAFAPTMTIERGGQTYATVRKQPFTLFHEHYNIDVSGGRSLEAGGDITNHEYEIQEAGQPVAAISRQWFTPRDSYGVAIAPGQDVALMLAAAVCIDELSERSREHHGGPSLPI